MKRKITCLLIVLLLVTASAISGCKGKDENKVIIYTSAADYEIEYLRSRLNVEFPDTEIIIEYLPTGNHAAKLVTEGRKTECDITYALEYGYLHKLEDAGVLADLSEYDFDKFTEGVVESKYFEPMEKVGGAIILNMDIIEEKGLTEPQTYEDLLDPQYKGLISMANPKSSGTAFAVFKSLANIRGDEEAVEYFDRLTENILQYTSSGLGPLNALIQGEAAVGIGYIDNAVKAINDGHNFKIIFFPEGAPYCLYGQGIIAGKEEKQAVKDVYSFLSNEFIYENCERFYPEKLFKDKDYKVENYPENIKYCDMGDSTIEEKERLLALWKH